jgi:hypothetical protein
MSASQLTLLLIMKWVVYRSIATPESRTYIIVRSSAVSMSAMSQIRMITIGGPANVGEEPPPNQTLMAQIIIYHYYINDSHIHYIKRMTAEGVDT